MRFYALGYEGTLNLPIRTFWFINATIDRLEAQSDIRSLGVAVNSQGGEGLENHREKLVMQVGTVVTVVENKMSVMNVEKDKAGIAELRAMMN